MALTQMKKEEKYERILENFIKMIPKIFSCCDQKAYLLNNQNMCFLLVEILRKANFYF